MGEPLRRRKHWGWGFEDEQPPASEVAAAAQGLAAHLGFGSTEPEEPVALEDVELPAPRIAPPAGLERLFTADAYERAVHAQGRSYSDVVRGFRGAFPHPPDAVAHPRDEADVARVLEWCTGARVACIPVGGGTSVVGGIDAMPGPGHEGAIAMNLRALDRVIEVDAVSRAARIQAGATGPALEQQLAGHGLTLRFFPQSFELSTLGGWIATRAGGHFATGPTHIDDLTEAVRAITPAHGAAWSSRRLPGSGAGPSPDRLLLGSEGAFGVITEAWVRILPRPTHRRAASVRFGRFADGVGAVREIVQAALLPANCRLVDAREAALTFAGDGTHHLLTLAFESGDVPVDERLQRALTICEAHGGEWEEQDAQRRGSMGAWRDAFLRAPYIRDTLVAMGVLSETFETAVTWDRLLPFIERVTGAAQAALEETCGAGHVTCRLTHAYPDGAAPYFTVVGPARRGDEIAQWSVIKRAASDAILAEGGTITHHHAVGRDHRPWYDLQRPEPFAAALRAAKAAVDPEGVLNPGVLIDAA
ncbi:MAG: Alkyldihydroxyacetonephosphate synthase [uncultured Solirubrobacteraceae bacterium]|uniref:Alkyldihydroxyacetonephosphate synthase n=1 Tax=uncultured Solirubrobacteraceae bacterium TaxID=1162706 RepID=A0A6J4S485_9ACTN|nr:MAG: Alkyldihydroxyacetonephosphate synthase [uncultured Solirubrobacteraceae bacterium]